MLKQRPHTCGKQSHLTSAVVEDGGMLGCLQKRWSLLRALTLAKPNSPFPHGTIDAPLALFSGIPDSALSLNFNPKTPRGLQHHIHTLIFPISLLATLTKSDKMGVTDVAALPAMKTNPKVRGLCPAIIPNLGTLLTDP